MKPSLCHPNVRLSPGHGLAVATMIRSLADLPLRADSPYTGTGWVIGAPLTGTCQGHGVGS
jgi:hypothetical protein